MRVLTILVRHGTEQYPRAEAEIDSIFARQLPEVERHVLVVDNALTERVIESSAQRTVIGGDNNAGEFSAFDRAIEHVGPALWTYDLVHFATSAFNTLHVNYLQFFDHRLLSAIVGRPVCLGHIDCYNEAVKILTYRSQHWIRTCFFFLGPTEVKTLGSFVSIDGDARFFSGNTEMPFRPDAPLDQTYRDYITNWLVGRDIGQGVEWHSAFSLTPALLPTFERKAVAIMNEQLLGARLRAMGCRLLDVTWAATMLAKGGPHFVAPATRWQEQLASRGCDALFLTKRAS